MSTPPAEPMPPVPPDQPPRHTNNGSSKEQFKGALVATLVIVLASALSVSINSSIGGLLISPVVALVCVVLGSILTAFQRTRQFAVGFLIASAILIFVSAGVCAVALRFSSGMA